MYTNTNTSNHHHNLNINNNNNITDIHIIHLTQILDALIDILIALIFQFMVLMYLYN